MMLPGRASSASADEARAVVYVRFRLYQPSSYNSKKVGLFVIRQYRHPALLAVLYPLPALLLVELLLDLLLLELVLRLAVLLAVVSLLRLSAVVFALLVVMLLPVEL